MVLVPAILYIKFLLNPICCVDILIKDILTQTCYIPNWQDYPNFIQVVNYSSLKAKGKWERKKKENNFLGADFGVSVGTWCYLFSGEVPIGGRLLFGGWLEKSIGPSVGYSFLKTGLFMFKILDIYDLFGMPCLIFWKVH